MDVIDLFAGAGGLSEGARKAGCRVLWAGNHWRLACEIHAANHPGTLHVCQDLHQANWLEVPAHDLLLAAPACQGHTPARGHDKPHHDSARATAWAVVSALEVHRTRFALVENVPGFLSWLLYPAWALALERLGYRISTYLANAADFGVPQERRRLILILTRGRTALQLRLPQREHVPISTVIRWKDGDWSAIHRRGRARATLDRIRSGRRRFGDRFVIPYYKSGSGLTGRSIRRPIGTITTVDRWAVVDGDRMRMLTVQEYRAAMAFPVKYILPAQKASAVRLLGNAVPPPLASGFIRAIRRAA